MLTLAVFILAAMIWRYDKYRRECWYMLLLAFGLGACVCPCIGRFNDWLIRMLRDFRCHKIILIQPNDRMKRKTDRRDAGASSAINWLQEESHVQRHGRPSSPPRTLAEGTCVELAQLWEVLPPTTRQNVLQTLSRVIAQQLPTPPTGQEVLHERD